MPLSSIPATGTASYNGYTFPAFINSRAQARPVYDQNRRHRKAIEYSITIETVIHDIDGGETTDQQWESLRDQLTEPGKALVFENKGFGGTDKFNINTTLKFDILYGPLPEMLVWEVLGDNKAVRIIWTVTVTLQACDEYTYDGAITEFAYSMSWDIDERGYTSRTVSGYIEIANRLTADGTGIQSTPDRHRDRIPVELIPGFIRSSSWSISADRRTLNFSVTDREHPSDTPLFPGLVRQDINYDLSNLDMGMHRWEATLSGSIELAAGVPKWIGWVAFLRVFKAKRDAAVHFKRKVRTPDGGYKFCPGGSTIIRNVSLSEAVFDRTLSFSIRWWVTTSLEYLIKGSGMWEPIPGQTWENYNVFMQYVNKAWTNRGHKQLAHSTSDDTIVTLCNNAGIRPIGYHYGSEEAGYPAVGLAAQKCPVPEASWLFFQNDVKNKYNYGQVLHKRLGATSEELKLKKPDTESTERELNLTRFEPPIRQNRDDNSIVVVMQGWAMRVCYPIPEIEISEYYGAAVSPIGEPYQTTRKLGDFGLPVYISRWKKEYLLHNLPDEGILTADQIPEECLQ